MENQQSLRPVIIDNDDSFCVFLPEKNVLGEGSTLEEAYCNFREVLAQRTNQEARYELADYSNDPIPHHKKTFFLRELGTFWLKVSTGIALACFIFVLLLPVIRTAIEHHATKVVNTISADLPIELLSKKFWAITVPTQLNQNYSNLSAAERNQLKSEWGLLLTRITYLLSENNDSENRVPAGS